MCQEKMVRVTGFEPAKPPGPKPGALTKLSYTHAARHNSTRHPAESFTVVRVVGAVNT